VIMQEKLLGSAEDLGVDLVLASISRPTGTLPPPRDASAD
jgi:hypothetical protein